MIFLSDAIEQGITDTFYLASYKTNVEGNIYNLAGTSVTEEIFVRSKFQLQQLIAKWNRQTNIFRYEFVQIDSSKKYTLKQVREYLNKKGIYGSWLSNDGCVHAGIVK